MSHPLALINGRIRTMDSSNSVAQAIFIANGSIVKVGTNESVRAICTDETEVVDLGGKTALPGLIDAHAHLISLGLMDRVIDARYPQVESIETLVRHVATMGAGLSDNEWVRGRGFDHAKYPEGRMPTRWDVDPVTPDQPVFLVHVTGHHALVNSRALELAGVDDQVEDPKGGHFVRDDRGRITGMLLDAAMQMVVPMVVDVSGHGPNHLTFPASPSELLGDVARGTRAFLKAGVTTVVDPQVTRREMNGYIDARRHNRLHARVHAMYLSNHLNDLIAVGLSGPIGDDRLAIGPMKFYCDGALLGGSADFYDPYDLPEDSRSRFWTPAEIRDLIVQAHRFGLQVGVHAQGDRAIKDTVDAIAAAQGEEPDRDRRHRIEHCGCPLGHDIERMAQLGIVPINQPGFVYQAGDDLAMTLGEKRAASLMPMRSELDHGLWPALSSDAPVGSHNPFHNIYAAVTRKTMTGQVVGSEERISLDEALRAQTIDAAWSIGREHHIGSLEPDKLGDVVVLDVDPHEASHERLREIVPHMTVLGGSVVYQRANEENANTESGR
jgi:predicted amidohydrolase YtcJ